MSVRGDKTRKMILEAAYGLFAGKGFKDVTMQDISEAAGISRGGLYRHYDGTSRIFAEIVDALMAAQEDEFEEKIRAGMPAMTILREVLERYRREMLDRDKSLSVAIYEYYSLPEHSQGENALRVQYVRSARMWERLIRYGIEREEFRETDPRAVYDLIVFAYQGVRMYGCMMPVDRETPGRITGLIEEMLIDSSDREERHDDGISEV